jgi:hypothetical protein
LLSAQWINSWWWTEELSETRRVSRQNKFVKLVHLVGFIIKKCISVLATNFLYPSTPQALKNTHFSCMHLTKMRCATCSLGISAGNRFSITSSSSCRGYNKNRAFCKSTETFDVHHHNKHHAMYITCLLHLQHVLVMSNHLLGEHLNVLTKIYVVITVNTYHTRSVRKVSSHFEYLENQLCGLDVTWQPVRWDLTAHPWRVTLPWG